MKNLQLLVWVTQLGLSVALPLGGFIFLAVWLRQRFDWGIWIIFVGIFLGIVTAVNGLRNSLKVMQAASKDKEEKTAVSFNDHE